MTFKNPLAQSGFPLVEGQIPVLGFTHHGHTAGYRALGLDKVGGVERCTAGFALVTVGAFISAMRALAHNVTVGKELPGLFVVELHRCVFDKLALVIQTAEKLACRSRMRVGSGT